MEYLLYRWNELQKPNGNTDEIMIDYENVRRHNNNSPDVTYLPNIEANPPTEEVIVLNGANPSTSRQTDVQVQQSNRNKRHLSDVFPQSKHAKRKTPSKEDFSQATTVDLEQERVDQASGVGTSNDSGMVTAVVALARIPKGPKIVRFDTSSYDRPVAATSRASFIDPIHTAPSTSTGNNFTW